MEAHACPADAIAAGDAPLPAPAAFIGFRRAETPAWHLADEPRRIYATIAELGNIAARLDALDHQHRFVSLGDAAATVGRLVEGERRMGMAHGWVRTLRPSNGASAVSQLWDQLASIREAWIGARMREAGFPVPHYDLPRAEAEHACAAWDELDAATLGVAEVAAAWGN